MIFVIVGIILVVLAIISILIAVIYVSKKGKNRSPATSRKPTIHPFSTSISTQ